MATVLVADDDAKITDMLRRTLGYEGFRVVTAADGAEALRAAETERPDLIVLDWMMPGLDGVEVARRLRGGDGAAPILMLSARDAIEDRVAGLDGGADDYMPKPFAPAELLARVRALLRRSGRDDERPLAYADLALDLVGRQVWRGPRPVELTAREFDLLAYFLRHPRRALPRERLLQAVWGYDFGGDGAVLDVYVGYLRAKTEAAGEARLIQTIRGVGYVLREAA